MKRTLLTSLALLGMAVPTAAATITFDTVVTGATSFAYDGDNDGADDVIFSTTDAAGFNTVGPGSNMSYINEPGIEGSTSLAPDLRVDFLVGATGSVSFGYAISTSGFVGDALTFSLFDATDNLLASSVSDADHTLVNGVTPSSFPEAFVQIAFGGTAAYGTFDFASAGAPRYIIDNFSGTFGTTEVEPVPEPASLLLLGTSVAALLVARRYRRK